MNEQNNYNFPPVGTKWLWFITYISFPLGALSNILVMIGVDFSVMDNATLSTMSALIFFSVGLPIATSIFLHKRKVEGYFLSFITPFISTFFFIYLWLINGSVDPASDAGAIIGGSIVTIINYRYMRKRRFLFVKNEIGPEKFNYIGMRTSLIVCMIVLVLSVLYASVLQKLNSVDQQLYSDLYVKSLELEEENNSLSNTVTELNTKIDSLSYKADFVDNYVRFVTETGTKYHHYECPHIQNSASIYYIFIDDPVLSHYTPCSDCDK